jgi:hypothetical protein
MVIAVKILAELGIHTMKIPVLILAAALATGCVVAPPAPVTPVGVNVGIGAGGESSTVIDNTVVNNVGHGEAPAPVTHHAGFAAAHPGFMAGLRTAGKFATAVAKVGGAAARAKALRNP